MTSDPRAWPIVGRADDLARIVAARDGGEARGVVLVGSAGVGKSRLAREAVADAARRGALAEWVQATRSAASVPLGALAALLPGDARSDDVLELMRSSVRNLREAAAGRPVVLAVDDAHLLDDTSAALVLHLAVTGTAFVVATTRKCEPCPDAVVSLWKDAGALRLDLRPLAERETGKLVEAALAGPVEETARRWVYDSSQGNVLYVCELLLGALESGALTHSSGLWRLSRRPPPSSSLTDVVSVRMSGLSEPVVRTLEVLALGEPLRLEELLELTGSEPLQEAEAHGLVQTRSSAEGGEVLLAHPVYGDVIEARMPGMRARATRLRLAEIVGRRAPRSPDDALRIARWLLDAGEPIAPDLLVEAARAANRAGDPDLGARLAGLALGANASVEAALLLARADAMRQRYVEADAVLAGVEDALDTQELGIEYLTQRMSVLFWGLERPQDARALLRRAREWWDDGVWQARLQAMDLQVATLSESFAGSLEASEQLLADPSLSERTRLRLQPVHLANLFFSGRARETYALSLQLRPLVPLPHQSDEYTLMMCCIVAAESGEDWIELRAWLTDTVQAAVRCGDHFAAGLAATTLGFLDSLAGRFADARRWLAEAEAQLERHEAVGALIATRLFAAYAAATTGDAETAGTMLAKVERTQPGPMTSPLKSHLARTRARVALAEGDLAAAQNAVLAVVDDFEHMPLYAAKLLYEAMRCGAPVRGLAARLEALRARCDSRMVETYAAHVAARAAGDAPGLLRSSDAFAAIGADLLAMEAAADAATAFAAEGRQDSARRAAARSLELHAPSQGGPPPEIVGLEPADVMLTRRETQLVALAARGMSNAEIAERLVVSVRTVESHLYRAMQKLGVSDRREL